MIIRFLLYIKHKFPFLWATVEVLNSFLFRLLYSRKMSLISNKVINEYSLTGYNFRMIEANDLKQLEKLIHSQPPERVTYFKPHSFDLKSIQQAFNNSAFLMMGVFKGNQMVGYFFLRFFWNKKCFVGRLIDGLYEGKGIGRVMNDIMYNIAWESDFRCMSTISKNNQWVMRSHANNPLMKVVKELDNDFLLVEFVKSSK